MWGNFTEFSTVPEISMGPQNLLFGFFGGRRPLLHRESVLEVKKRQIWNQKRIRQFFDDFLPNSIDPEIRNFGRLSFWCAYWLRIARKWDMDLIRGALKSSDTHLSNAQKIFAKFWFSAIIRPKIGQWWSQTDPGRKSVKSGRKCQDLLSKAVILLKKP